MPDWSTEIESRWNSDVLESYREGYADALQWVLDNCVLEVYDRDQIEEALSGEDEDV